MKESFLSKMRIHTVELKIKSKGKSEIIDITGAVSDEVSKSKLSEGIVNIFVPGSTASVSTIEFEPGLLKDVPKALDKIAPFGPDYEHHNTWHDDNGASHVRATLMGPSMTVPFKDKKLLLGTWQQIVLIDHDTRDRERIIVLTLIGG